MKEVLEGALIGLFIVFCINTCANAAAPKLDLSKTQKHVAEVNAGYFAMKSKLENYTVDCGNNYYDMDEAKCVIKTEAKELTVICDIGTIDEKEGCRAYGLD